MKIPRLIANLTGLMALSAALFGPRSLAQDTISIALGSANTENGLFLKEPDGGATSVVTAGGSSARSTLPPEGKTGGYMYFATDPAFANNGSVSNLFVTIEYFDSGTDVWRLEYDAQPDPENPNPDVDAFTPAEGGNWISKYDTQKWITHQFRLTDIYFGKRQPGGSDFRIYDRMTDVDGNPIDGEAPEFIRKVVVSKVEPIPLHIKFASAPVKLDGVLDDAAWQEAQPFIVNSIDQDVIRPSHWQGTNDYALDARYAWDTNYLYLAYNVTDDVPRASLDNPDEAWNGDGTEVYFGFDQSSPGRTAYLPKTDFQVAITVGQNPTWEILQGGAIIWTPTDGGPFQPADNVSVKDKSNPPGYILEARIPWAMLTGPDGITNKPPVPGQLAGFNVLGNDGDNLETPAQEKAMSFTGRPQAYLHPSAWATVQMDGPAAVAAPSLKAARAASGKLRVSWSSQSSGFTLQQTAALPGGNWTAVNGQPSVEGAENVFLIQPEAATTFYRLAR